MVRGVPGEGVHQHGAADEQQDERDCGPQTSQPRGDARRLGVMTLLWQYRVEVYKPVFVNYRPSSTGSSVRGVLAYP
jgi:hypothetical protein